VRRPVSTRGGGSGCRFVGAGYRLGCGQVEVRPGRVGVGDGDVVLQAAVAGGLVGGGVLPAAPDDAARGAFGGADRVGVVVVAGCGGGVALGRRGCQWRVVVASVAVAAVRRWSQPRRKAATLRLADLTATGVMPASAASFGAAVAGAAVADLRQRRGGADLAVGVAKRRQEDVVVGVGADAVSDLARQLADFGQPRPEGGDQGEHDRAARVAWRFAGAFLRRVAELAQQLRGCPLAAVGVACQKRREALVLACASRRPDRDVPLRALIDGFSTNLRPVVACGTSPRPKEQVSRWPCTGQAPRTLTRRKSRQPEDDQ
jgi:hypothetical protein